MDIKRELADRVCELLGYRIFPGRCDICGYPLLEKCLTGTWFLGCWFCNERRTFAFLARATLQKARMREIGIEIGIDQVPMLLQKPEEDLGGRKMYGSPL